MRVKENRRTKEARKQKEWERRNQRYTIVFLSLPRLLFKLLWVDPAVLCSRDCRQKFCWVQTTLLRNKTKESFLLVWNLLHRMISFHTAALEWVCWERPAKHCTWDPSTPGIWILGCVRASRGTASPPVRSRQDACDPVLICSVPAACWPRPWTFPAQGCRHVCSVPFPLPLHRHGLFLSNTVLSTLGDFCACANLSKRIKNNSSVSGTLPKQCPYLASCWGVNTFWWWKVIFISVSKRFSGWDMIVRLLWVRNMRTCSCNLIYEHHAHTGSFL